VDYDGRLKVERGFIRPEAAPKLSGLMITELSAHRTMAMRLSLANNPQTAFLAATHALALNAFCSASSHSCGFEMRLADGQISAQEGSCSSVSLLSVSAADGSSVEEREQPF
jgi:hypothetical protein